MVVDCKGVFEPVPIVTAMTDLDRVEVTAGLGLSERIVDLVQTGETLRKNGLVEVEHIMNITSKLVCNRASLKTKPRMVKALVGSLGKAVGEAAKL